MGFRLYFALLVVAALFSAALLAPPAAAATGYGGDLGMEQQQQLNGSTGRWSSLGVEEEDEEWALPSETARRFLSSGTPISYNTLDKNKQAARSGKPGNSYTRPCGAGIYHCR